MTNTVAFIRRRDGHRARPPVVFVAGEGSWLTDSEGRRYLDFIQGWAVNCLGHSPPAITQALARQAERLINCSPAFYNDQMIRLAELLRRHSGLHQVFLANSGAEANEGAIKLARKWGAKYRDGASEIITMDHGFHGRTLATMSASGKPQWEHLYEPKVSGFVKVPLNDLAAVEAAITPRTVAVMLEPIQGEAGVFEATVPFLRGLRALTRERGVLLILDEIQTGIGRTGRLFGFEHAGRHARYHDAGQGSWRRRAAGRTGRASRRLLLRVRRSGRHVLRQSADGRGRLRGDRGGDGAWLSRPSDARPASIWLRVCTRCPAGMAAARCGAGACLLALDLRRDIASEVADAALARGLLVNAPRPDSLRFMPALTVSDDEIDRMIDILDGVLGDRLRRPAGRTA